MRSFTRKMHEVQEKTRYLLAGRRGHGLERVHLREEAAVFGICGVARVEGGERLAAEQLQAVSCAQVAQRRHVHQILGAVDHLLACSVFSFFFNIFIKTSKKSKAKNILSNRA